MNVILGKGKLKIGDNKAIDFPSHEVGIELKHTPDLSQSFHPMPKPSKKGRGNIILDKKTEQWNNDRVIIKKQFEVWGIFNCEIKIPSRCKKFNFLSFAHKKRRRKLTAEDIKNPREVVLACTPCHDYVDYAMEQAEGERFLTNIIIMREKYLKEHGVL